MKNLVETVGGIQFLDTVTGTHIRHSRPTVAKPSSFIQQQLGIGNVRVLGKVRDSATDADFADHWKACDGDRELAIESFLSEHGLDAPLKELKELKEPKEPKEPKAPKTPPAA